ncbi:hypothetical protein GGI21_001309 [Coemansia aciculifera]|nr:hypothetical protein GGI21_001309 [Coemansia aciculifera]
MTFKDFKLFTANDSSIPCIQQVIEYFGEVFNEDSTIEDMLAPRKVIYGHPAKGNFSQVKEYADFVWDYHEDMATTDYIEAFASSTPGKYLVSTPYL